MSRKLTYGQVKQLADESSEIKFIMHTRYVLGVVDGYIERYGFAKEDFIFTLIHGYISVSDILNTEAVIKKLFFCFYEWRPSIR